MTDNDFGCVQKHLLERTPNIFLIRSHHKEANIKIKSKICNKLLILSTYFKTIGVTLNIKEQDNHAFEGLCGHHMKSCDQSLNAKSQQ